MEEMRAKRLAMLEKNAKTTPAKAPAPATPAPKQTPTPAASTPAKATPVPAPAPPSATRVMQTPEKLLQQSLENEANCGYVVRYVFQIKQAASDFEEDKIPSLLTAVYKAVSDTETDGYDPLNVDAGKAEKVFHELDTSPKLSLEQIESLLSHHRRNEDTRFLISCFGRVKDCLQDSLLKQALTTSFAAIRRGIVVFYLTTFIPSVLEEGPERLRALEALLTHADTPAVSDMLDELSLHLSSQDEVGEEILLIIARFLLNPSEKEGQKGLPVLPSYASYLVRLCGSSSGGAQVLLALLKEETTQRASLPAHIHSLLRRFWNCPTPEEMKTLVTGIQNYPKVDPAEVDTVLNRPRDIIASLNGNFAELLKESILKKKGEEGRGVILAWLKYLLRQCSSRVKISKNNQQRMLPDVFALNLALLAFILSEPVCQRGGDKASLDITTTIQGVKDFGLWEGAKKLGNFDEKARAEPAKPFGFSTDILFVGFEAMHCVVAPAVRCARWAHENFQRAMSMLYHSGQLDQAGSNPRLVMMAAQWDYLRLQLLNPRFVDLATSHAVTAVRIIHRELLKAGEGDLPAALAATPLYLLEDALDWAVFLCHYAPDLVKGAEGMPKLLEFATLACTHPTLLRNHPMLEARIVLLISALQEQSRTRSGMGDDAWHASQWSNARSATSLFKIVENSPARDKLPQLLFRVYSASVTEGFDIDIHDHLAHAKDQVIPLFVQLIVDGEFKKGLQRCMGGAGSEDGSDDFSQFVYKLATEGTHCLDDALNRLSECNDIEQIKANKAQWAALNGRAQSEKEQHLAAQKRSAQGFMASAKKTLDIVQMLLNPTRADTPPELPPALRAVSVLRSLSHLVRYFLAQLYGKRGNDLKTLPTPGKYGYDRLGIVQTLCNIVALLYGAEEFVKVFALHDDYERWVMNATVTEVERTQLGGRRLLEPLKQFADALQALAPQSAMPPVADIADAAWNPPTGQRVEVLEEKFTEAFEDIHFEQSDLGGEEGYVGYSFREETTKDVGAGQKQLAKAFKREWKLFAELPLYPQASVFVRADENRMDVMKVIITGPEESPYAFGMFVFDVLLPSGYPDHPPMVLLRTTGGGTVRFNPNLYENGKVCLSLLGTWYGDGEETKWQPGKSSLYQVGTSIQSMILVPDPYFNEPGNEREQGTPEGAKWSAEYNEGLRLATLRYAVMDNLKNPPKGCEDIVAKYYDAMAPVVMATAHRWASEASDARRPKFLAVLKQLEEALGSKTGDNEMCKWVEAGKATHLTRKRERTEPDLTRPAAQPPQPNPPGEWDMAGLGQNLLQALGNPPPAPQGGDADMDDMDEDEALARALQASLQDF
eukprot:TRINITY_DN6367_c0_g2_i1.p1 TRINITY_DN6367_c0_g2~~TRINITY_DN6367_c0_g2_i1.p1  ORF type:complete len:1434 (+),score=607.00 TRINITY_DN6367_c0_g2_i1:285-4304(+)